MQSKQTLLAVKERNKLNSQHPTSQQQTQDFQIGTDGCSLCFYSVFILFGDITPRNAELMPRWQFISIHDFLDANGITRPKNVVVYHQSQLNWKFEETKVQLRIGT
jgi:hypothetical protein